MPLHCDNKEVVTMQMEGMANVIWNAFINDYKLKQGGKVNNREGLESPSYTYSVPTLV